MNKEQYTKYVSAVESNLKHLNFVSTGACPGCKDCGELTGDPSPEELDLLGEPHFSWSPCESCGSTLGGDRHPAHGRDANNEIMHFGVCTDCLYFLNYGRLDDQTMMEIDTNHK